ncbi:protein spinster homolog 3 isoform X3 [Zalophus californianus]|uniref:Protein spinster homolog 3 isoform X3 n=1 Tax=Zalophus californianus TaxID=9704 RepID=A0A6J2B1E5_ZALCA|nr:protein spinster homolog 3 isoform X3 [Zalophus californianus]
MCLCPGSHPGSGAQAGEAGAMSAEGWDTGPGGHPGASGAGPCPPGTASAPWSLPHWRACLAAAVLCYINLLNYMNWFIVAGMLLDIQNFFQISDSNAGLLQTVFICSLLLSAPVFGYLGDRHGRKATLSVGILLWSGAGLSSSFISPQHPWLFFLSRGVVGIGSASYSTIAPTVLGDLFVRDQRTRVLAIFYIFIPVGSGLGYVLGSAVLQLTGNWHWAFRVLPCLEAVALILLIALVPDPPRGAAEKQEEVAMGALRSSWCEDVRYLGRNWSFVWSTLGVTAIAFVTGALGFWAPKFLFEARVVHGLQLPCLQDLCNEQDSLIFGILTVVTGIIGVVLGAEASRRYKKVNPRAESLICAYSLLIAAPCLYLALILAPVTLLASYQVGVFHLCSLTWPPGPGRRRGLDVHVGLPPVRLWAPGFSSEWKRPQLCGLPSHRAVSGQRSWEARMEAATAPEAQARNGTAASVSCRSVQGAGRPGSPWPCRVWAPRCMITAWPLSSL